MPCRPQDRSPTIGGVPLPLIFLRSVQTYEVWRGDSLSIVESVGQALQAHSFVRGLIPASLAPRVICLKNEGLDRLQAGFSACTPVLHLSPTCTIDSFLVQA